MILPRNKWTRQKAKPGEYHLIMFDPGGTIGWAHFVLDFRAFSRPEHKALAFAFKRTSTRVERVFPKAEDLTGNVVHPDLSSFG